MEFGICTSVDNGQAVAAAGWDYVEEIVVNFLQGLLPDGQWTGLVRMRRNCPLPVPAANVLVPAVLRITGPEASLPRLTEYLHTVFRRAKLVGIDTLVFGSAGARMVPDGWPRDRARMQVLDFCRIAADLAEQYDLLLVAEHLNRGECNIINSVNEAMEYVDAINHPRFQCLVDSYHFWLENESLEDLKKHMPRIRHVHLADTEKRVPPGESMKNDYRPFFKVLKAAGYDHRLTIEPANYTNIAESAPRVLAFIKQQWADA